MPTPTLLRSVRVTKTHKLSAAVLAAAGATAALTIPAATGDAHAATSAAPAAVKKVSANGQPAGAKAKAAEAKAGDAKETATLADSVKITAVAGQGHTAKEAASRAADRKPVEPAKPKYADNLDGWIKESLAIMKEKGIPGSYEGLHRNIMRESSGNPRVVNDWDINAKNGIPSKGLLQVIQPTFERYHVEGTANDLFDPVANITAAANYAAHRYGSMDNVNSAY
ncbi:transglycosylase SLT domain-containing protein [Streptomyces rimosus]|uniref:transglycosylase SLT domain-containing protein n=1 Tax=Streptomyces rimosus TaxID=1927 RepID=UPI0004CAEA4A|nr:transglycosylase SLT domain-containing protein [Streptomyces rimosus]KOT78448.1 lytic transglycosylase [Streptomyces rimosus subsp. pseudoverticillatus]